MKTAWAWLKKWWALVAGALAVGLAALGVWRYQQRKLGEARDKAAVAEALRRADSLRARREEVARQVGEKDSAIAVIDEALEENKRRIVDLHEGGEHIPDDELDDALRRLGY